MLPNEEMGTRRFMLILERLAYVGIWIGLLCWLLISVCGVIVSWGYIGKLTSAAGPIHSREQAISDTILFPALGIFPIAVFTLVCIKWRPFRKQHVKTRIGFDPIMTTELKDSQQRAFDDHSDS